FDLAAALEECRDLLVRHGGHAMAAGLTIHPDQVPALRARLNEIARRTLRPEQLQPPLPLDALAPLGQLTATQVREFGRLRPFGQGNPAVQVLVPGLRLRRAPQRIGREQQHVKFWVTDGRTGCEAVWWGAAERPWPSGVFDLACAPQLNEFNGRCTVQLRVLDWRPAG
ncbi:MAG: hypothetical protein FJ387_29200, partial [Verrucomicrobia bacterium]|nr:hypothetical protein [Verrucomicrobiota bacterium]